MWGLIVEAIRTVPAQRSADQQNVVDWLTEVMHRRALAGAKFAGWEYLKWAGNADATDPMPDHNTLVSRLDRFSAGTLTPVNYNHGTPDNSTSGFCRYTSPAPYQSEYTGNISTPVVQNTADSWCFPPYQCSALLGCNDRQPSFDQFVKWGEADVAAHRNQDADGAILSTQVVDALAFVGAAVGAGLTGIVLASTLGPVLTGSALATALFPWASVALLEFGEFTAALAPAIAGGMAAAAVAAVVVAIIAAIAIAAVVGVQIVQSAAVPGRLSSLIKEASSGTPDLRAMLGDANQLGGLFGMFIEAALPSPSLAACDNSAVTVLKLNGTAPTPCLNAPPIPAPAIADPQFLITPKDSSQTTRSDTLRWTDAVQAVDPLRALDNIQPVHIAQDSARVTGNWFVTQSTPAGGTTSPEWQSLSMHYVDWDLQEHTAWLRPNDDGSYSFLVAAGHQIGVGSLLEQTGMVNPNTCLALHRCAVSDSINYEIFSWTVGSEYNPQRLTAKLVPVVPPTISVTRPDTVTEGTPARLSATATGGTDGAMSYEWYLESTISNINPTCSGGQKFCGYNGPYRGDHIEYTFQAPGPRKGILLVTETGGSRTFRKDFTVDVAGVPPTLTIDNYHSWVSFGDSTTITGTVAHAGADDFETVTVDWGDGSSDTANSGINFCAPTCPKVTFTRQSRTEFGFTGTHTYAHAGKYTVTVTVTDGVGGGDSVTQVRKMTVAATTTSL
ncbi:MAG TPA: PKD domain-containing protein, partial [Pseudonocardia sp.]|nr:PKD domain-containing protein [Pseudonocardia sp.]